jgi:hypothetical protein
MERESLNKLMRAYLSKSAQRVEASSLGFRSAPGLMLAPAAQAVGKRGFTSHSHRGYLSFTPWLQPGDTNGRTESMNRFNGFPLRNTTG